MGSEAREPIPFTVVGGYLGSGKTTLINRLLEGCAGRRVAVLVNDFGAVNIDARLIESTDGETLELANGCICCSLANGFVGALRTVLARDVPPEHLVVEASGIADPWRIAQIGLTPGLALDGIVVLADAETVEARTRQRYVGDVVSGQLGAADLVVLNKTDLVAHEALARTLAWLRAQVPDARVVQASYGDVPPDVLLAAGGTAARGPTPRGQAGDAAGEHAGGGTDAGDGRAGGPHAAGKDVFATALLAERRPLDRATLGEFLSGLPTGIYRAKGLVRLADEPHQRTLLQLVGRRWSLVGAGPWAGTPPASEVVVIGSAAALAAAGLDERFAGCVAGAPPAAGSGRPPSDARDGAAS